MQETLTTEGVIFMALAWTSVMGLTAYCIIKVLRHRHFNNGANDD